MENASSKPMRVVQSAKSVACAFLRKKPRIGGTLRLHGPSTSARGKRVDSMNLWIFPGNGSHCPNTSAN